MPVSTNVHKTETAALLLAEGKLSEREIARELGIDVRTITRWKKQQPFRDRIQALTETLNEAVKQYAIAERQNRVGALDDRWERMKRVIIARATDPALSDVPGGQTGLLVRQMKQIGAGRDAQVVEEYAVDTGLLRELRAHEQQAAQELGQWADKHEHSGELIVREYVGISLEDV